MHLLQMEAVHPYSKRRYSMKNKHFTFEERCIIEEYLNKGESVHKIALKLEKPDSSIVREIKRNRYLTFKPKQEYCRFLYEDKCLKQFRIDECMPEGGSCRRSLCRGCEIMCNKERCNDFEPFICKRLRKSPFVCNGCPDIKTCHLHLDSCKYKYQARLAEIMYQDNLKESRQGIALTDEEMEALDNLVSPLLLQGQSIHAIFINHKSEIPVSETTLYEYVDHCYLTARNIDLPRKVRFKPRYSHGPREKSFQEFAVNRTYIDYKKYLEEHPDANIWEMDTVIGEPGGKCLLTLLFRKSTFMIAILLETHTQDAVIEALNDICRTIGIKLFQKLFNVIITDRGVEFGNPYAIECDENGEIKTKLFYCDPYCSWQKGMVEKNHEFIRMVLPKGKSFNNLSQMDIHLMMNHINNYPRKSLNGATPFELSKLLLGKDFLQLLGYHKIPADSVILKPMLLQKPKDNK